MAARIEGADSAAHLDEPMLDGDLTRTAPPRDYLRFAEFLTGLSERPVVGFEATGNYHRPLAFFLAERGFGLRLISSVAAARTREALFNSWDKNDPKDAQVIIHLLKTGVTQHYHDPLRHQINELQELSKTHFHRRRLGLCRPQGLEAGFPRGFLQNGH